MKKKTASQIGAAMNLLRADKWKAHPEELSRYRKSMSDSIKQDIKKGVRRRGKNGRFEKVA